MIIPHIFCHCCSESFSRYQRTHQIQLTLRVQLEGNLQDTRITDLISICDRCYLKDSWRQHAFDKLARLVISFPPMDIELSARCQHCAMCCKDIDPHTDYYELSIRSRVWERDPLLGDSTERDIRELAYDPLAIICSKCTTQHNIPKRLTYSFYNERAILRGGPVPFPNFPPADDFQLFEENSIP